MLPNFCAPEMAIFVESVMHNSGQHDSHALTCGFEPIVERPEVGAERRRGASGAAAQTKRLDGIMSAPHKYGLSPTA